MGKVFTTLLEFAGISSPKRRPTARGRAPAPRAKPIIPSAPETNRSRPNAKPAAAAAPEPRRRTLPPPARRPESHKPKARPVQRPAARRKARPVGGLKMGVILALCIVCGTWLGSQVQGIAASHTAQASAKDLAVFQPVSTTFTF